MKIKNRCPFCGGKIIIRRVRCKDCGVEYEGEFELPEYIIEEDIWDFIKLYLKVRGNLKEVERILGLSYPTVRAKFEEIRKALGFKEEYDDKAEIIFLLERGDISVEEALKRLEGIEKKDERRKKEGV